ncbi:MAG: aminotransferase class V-fold PLP-dependent enzyme [Phycisphaerales bacterium]
MRFPSSDLAFSDPFAERDCASMFPLDRSYTFLNHGSFGSVPFEVLTRQQALRMEIEARPIEMLDRNLKSLLPAARAKVAAFVGVAPERLGFVTNATEGVNAILRSFDWTEGDEVLVVDHVYNAMRQSLRRMVREVGLTYREVEVRLPVRSADDWIESIRSAIGDRTRMQLIAHITSPTALVLPVAEIVRLARARGIFTLIDGAHAPGSIALSVDALGADAYTANLHKWVCAPKGCAFLAVREGLESSIHPLATSHFLGEGFGREFDWQGTRDVTPWLAAPAAIEFFERFDWKRVRERNHAMAGWVQRFLCACWCVDPLSPIDGSMLASMAAVRLPAGVQSRFRDAPSLQAHLYGHHRIELPVIDWKGAWHVRVSCHLHTSPELVERLAGVVLGLRDAPLAEIPAVR